MCINLGSVEPLDVGLLDSYSLIRYRIHGPASVLSRRTWSKLLLSPIATRSPGGHFDSAVEAFLKRLFMVTPNNSRYLDSVSGGTHAPVETEDGYFSLIRQSWVGVTVPVAPRFRFR